MQVRRFTASGNVLTAAISPDGKYIATVLDEGGLQSLWLRQVAANTSGVRLLAPALVEYWGLTFSNDSNFIYYVSWVRNQSDAELYQLPVLGGTARRVPTLIDTPISFAPAGDRFTYVFSSSSKGESYVKTAGVDGGEGQTLAKRRQPGFFAAWPGGPAWSPDGRFIAYAATAAADLRHLRVFVANVEDKAERQLSKQSWGEIGRVAWLGDGSGLVISAREQKDGPCQLWFVAYPDGSARKITNDLDDYASVSLSGDAKTLAAVQTKAAFSIAVTPYGEGKQIGPDLSHARKIFSEVSNGRESIAWTPDNRIVYCSRASGNWDIWLMNKDGSEQKQLTVDSHNDLFPAVSADGRYIFFASDRAGAFNIWRMALDGSKQVGPTQLTRGANQIFPEVTKDGQWVVYQQGLGPDKPSIWKVAAAGGEAQRLADSSTVAQRPAVSPDGRLLAYVNLEGGWGLTVHALEGGKAVRRFLFPSTVSSRIFRWTPDGQALALLVKEKGTANIWLQPLSGAPPSQLTNFKAGQLLAFAWSPDGRWLAYTRHTATSDVVLLRDFK
jgi:Tol biopolymer transport system component